MDNKPVLVNLSAAARVTLRSDGWFAASVLACSAVLVLFGGELTASVRSPWWLLIAALQCGGVVLRRRSPGSALMLCWVGALAQILLTQEIGPQNITVLVILYSVAAYGSGAIRMLGVASAVAGGALAGWYVAIVIPNAEGRPVGSIVFLVVLCVAILVLAWGAGLLRAVTKQRIRDRVAADVAAERARHAIAVEEERSRIARDVHDVVAHSLTVMIAHAEGARLAAEANAAVTPESLHTIADTGRAALAEVRGVLAEMRSGERDSPQPSLRRLDALADQLRQAGPMIEVIRTGTPVGLAAQVDMAAFRILQEALTNAVRHGDRSAPISVVVDWSTATMLVLTVQSALRRDAAEPSGGHGVVGMIERAQYVGGTVTAAADGAGAFVVTAELPVSGRGPR